MNPYVEYKNPKVEEAEILHCEECGKPTLHAVTRTRTRVLKRCVVHEML